MNIKDSIAWYKVCLTRANGYINIYNALGLTIIIMDKYNIPHTYIPIGIIGIMVMVLIVGSIDILSGVLRQETKISHEHSPVLMEILKNVKK